MHNITRTRIREGAGGGVTKVARGGDGNVLIVVVSMSSFTKCTLSMHAVMSFIILKFCFLKKEIAFVMPLKPVPPLTACAPCGPTSGHVWGKTPGVPSPASFSASVSHSEMPFPTSGGGWNKKALPRVGSACGNGPRTLLQARKTAAALGNGQGVLTVTHTQLPRDLRSHACNHDMKRVSAQNTAQICTHSRMVHRAEDQPPKGAGP